jgi:hypothetical protein
MTATAAEGYVTDVAYIPGFYPNLAPTAIRHVAALNRVAPPSVAGGFRYLELGCGLGRSLTTLAAANPQGEFATSPPAACPMPASSPPASAACPPTSARSSSSRCTASSAGWRRRSARRSWRSPAGTSPRAGCCW